MACKGKRNKGKLEFSKLGHRRTSVGGLYYHSKCGGYALYEGDLIYGVESKSVRWIAFSVTDGIYRVIARHFSRKSAERACEFDKSHTE